ncbi:MAG: DUF4012 domain-containing protein [Patescibacteria group bacterium]
MLRKIVIIGSIIFLGAIGTGSFWLWQNYQNGRLPEKIITAAFPAIKNSATGINVFQSALGMGVPRTYLVLLLNNTELRPGGGFIGSYAIVRFDKGKSEVLKVEGTEILDNNYIGFVATPPPPLAKYLGLKNWQFRDSNWSPDFPTDAKKALEFYRAEHGVEAENISGVIAITPNIFEEILKLVGPITVDGIKFTSENFTETLEYEVEYGFEKRGVKFRDRKQLLGDVWGALWPRLASSFFTNWSDYKKLIPALLREKQVMLYSTVADEEAKILEQDWGGEMKSEAGDYLLWVDANLDSLKTDVAVTRSLSYSITPSSSSFVAKATMRYYHTGGFSWRTSRYRDYARVFVPAGSRLVGSSGNDGKVDQGEEGGRHWFGAFISINPGKQGELSFTYLLPKSIADGLEDGQYYLGVQKQLGTDRIRLTLELKFDKKLTGAIPPESSEKFGDNLYQVAADLSVDREFEIELTKSQ